MNNIAFALAEIGRLDEAEKCIASVSHLLHKNAYLTATFGLLSFRRGRREQGESLYMEAISLASDRHSKTRIRQKMNLELAKLYSQTSEVDALRSLSKVLKERNGEAALIKQAHSLMKKLKP